MSTTTTITIPNTRNQNGDDDVSGKNKNSGNNGASSQNQIKILCFDITPYNKTTQFLLCCLGVFILFLIYGYLQELIFTLDGFKPYGWYLTLVQFLYYTIFGSVESCFSNSKRQIPIKTYLVLAALTLGTMGFSNSSLGYLNYPTEVIFKSCKLVPVLIGSVLIQKKKHTFLDFLAAIFMCVGLALFTLADSQVQPNFNTFGIFLISMALVCDAAIGNVQEKAMREHKAPNHEVVFYSYGIGFIYLLVIMVCSGHFFTGTVFCMKHPIQTYGYAFIFSITGYLGIQIVLTLVRTTGAPIAATVTTARKAVTICLSFVFFHKPFTFQYVWSGLIVVVGIYLNVYSKQNKMTFSEAVQRCRKCLYRSGKGESSKRLLEDV